MVPGRADEPVLGPDAASVLVLLHEVAVSGGCGIRSWSSFRTAIGVDLPGHGSQRAEPYSFPAAVEQVRQLLAAHTGPVVIVGASLGVYIGPEAATEQPTQLRGLILIGASADPRRWLLRVVAGTVYAAAVPGAA